LKKLVDVTKSTYEHCLTSHEESFTNCSNYFSSLMQFKHDIAMLSWGKLLHKIPFVA